MYNHEMNRLERTFFPVEKREGATKDGKPANYIIDTQSMQVISVVSDKYKLIPNKQVIMPFVDKFGMPEKITTYAGRKSYIYEFSTRREFDMGDGDRIRERVVVGNSYDKTKRFWTLLGGERMVCLNGLYMAFGAFFFFGQKHIGEIDVDNIVKLALSSYQTNDFSYWKKLKQQPLLLDDEKAIIDNWMPFEEGEVSEQKKRWGYTETQAMVTNRSIRWRATNLVSKEESLNNQRNGWGLYNQMNRAVADELYGYSNHSKRILGDKRIGAHLSEKLGVKA